MNLSRKLAKQAAIRESVTNQPKELVKGIKGTITIKNYLGGYYYFTSDEMRVVQNNLYLVEAKHSKSGNIASKDDIKDGLIKMILYTNLKEVKINGREFNPVPILKLTSGQGFKYENLTQSQKEMLKILQKEARINNFKIELE